MFLKYISLVILLGSTSYGANILGIIPTTSYSHQIAYAHLWKELSLRGHKVTTITSNPLKDPTLTNLTEIDVNWLYKYYDAVSNTLDMSISMWHIYDIWIQFMVFMSDEQLSYAPIQNLIHNKTNFDIVLVESFFPEFLGFAEIYKCPKILISSFQTNAYYHHAMGNPIHPLLHPDIMTPFYGALNFKERVTATLFGWYLSYFFSHKIIPEKEAILRKYFNVEATVEELVYDVDMLFINENPAVQEAKAVGPTTINIGGLRQPISPNSLPQEIQEYLDNATEGFIYFSLGTNIRSKDLDEQTLRTLNEVFEEVPYKVLWKFEADELPGKPENIKLIKWAPQQNVLSHPNIKLFITQAGLQSMEETITSEVPCVVIPIYADQEKNAKLMKRKGFAEIVERTPFLEKEELKKAILEVINNPRYKNSVKRLKQLILDAPMTGLEKAIWWTEYVIRNKGAKHLRNPAADLPFYQYYLLDVISFLILTTISVITVITLLAKKIYKLFFYYLIQNRFTKIKKIQ